MDNSLCNLCGSSTYSLMHRGRGAEKVFRCVSCRLAYSPFQTSIAAGKWQSNEESGLRSQANLILSKISRHKSRGRLLQIMAGNDFFAEEAQKRGYQTESVTVDDWLDEKNRRDERLYDVIVMKDTLPYLTDPKKALQEARRLLKNDGVMYVSTPDIESFWSRILGARWWGMGKRHLFYFSRQTLENYFKVVGFKPVRYYSYPRVFSLAHWALRLKTYPGFIHKPFEAVSRVGSLGKYPLKIVLHDQLGVVVRKIQRLDSVIVEESKKEIIAKKQKVIVVLPAYNAEKTLERTVADIPRHCVDEIVLVDDCSRDKTVEVAKRLGLTVVTHAKNRGYGGNQKTCYAKAIEMGADIAVMCHPDYQYDPKIIPQLIEPILRGEADAVFGSRMMKGGALQGGMPLWKHNANILLTALENVVLGTYLTEYHSGFRAYSTRLLKHINIEANSDNFIFDTEIIAQILANHFKIEEVPIRTRYFEEASSIRLWPSIVYGCGILRVMVEYTLHSMRWIRIKKFEPRS